MPPIQVLAIAGSPRRHGNSEEILDWVIGAMNHHPDVIVEKVILVNADISPCRGCNACEKLNRCVISDGMDTLHDRILAADLIILSTPVYCMSLCSQAKALVDRMQVFRSRKYVLHLPVIPPERVGKRLGLFISTAGQTWDYVFDASIPVSRCFFHVIGVREKDTRYLLVNGVDEKGAVRNHPTAKADAERLATELILTLRERLAV